MLLLAGCTPAYRPDIHLAESVVRPDTAVLLITVDGMSEEVLDAVLAEGALPHMRRLIERGVRAREAVCSLPSLTYPNLTTILTGLAPSRHGILGNKWFDRAALAYRDYTTAYDYRLADEDLFAPTVYAYLGDDYGVSIQCAVRRGAGRVIDNWASSGLRWLFGAFEAVDQLMPLRFDIIAEESHRRGRWPALIHAYFPGADEIGHRYGSDSARYREALINIDRQIGLMGEALTQAGMAERTCTIVVSDHNHTPVPGSNWFDVAGWLRREAGLRVMTEPPPNEPWERRRRRYADVDAVVAVGGDRIAAVHLRGPGGWHERPTAEQVAAVLHNGFANLAQRRELDAMAWAISSAEGRRLVRVESSKEGALFAAIAEMFESPRAGDLVLFAAEGWDFRLGGAGGHGGLGPRDTRVPMIFSGSMIDRGAVIEAARLVDVTPTILSLLGKCPPNADAMFDGRDLSAVLITSSSGVRDGG